MASLNFCFDSLWLLSQYYSDCVCEDAIILRTHYDTHSNNSCVLFYFFRTTFSVSHSLSACTRACPLFSLQYLSISSKNDGKQMCACVSERSGDRIKVKEIHDKKRANQDHWLQINFEIDNISCTLPTQPFIALLLPLLPASNFFPVVVVAVFAYPYSLSHTHSRSIVQCDTYCADGRWITYALFRISMNV